MSYDLRPECRTTYGSSIGDLRPDYRTTYGLNAGRCRVWIGASDGTEIERSRIGNIEVYATTDVTVPVSEWTRLPGNLLTAGNLLFIDDMAAGSHSARFYCTMERP